MGILVNLPLELENRLALEAKMHGMSLPDYVLHLLSQSASNASVFKTGAEVVAYWKQEGLIGARADITDSSEHARSVRQEAETRQRG